MKTSNPQTKLLFLLIFSIIFINNICAQKDIIVTSKGDTVKCSIYELNDEKIFFEIDFKARKVKTNYLKKDIKSFQFYYIDKLKEENDTLSVYTILLRNGTNLTGKIISIRRYEIDFNDYNIGKITIHAEKISKIDREDVNAYYFITLIDGTEFNGNIVNHDQNKIKLNTKDLGNINIPLNKIKSIRKIEESLIKDGKIWFPNPNSTRYLFAPSAFGLKKGEGYYQNAYMLANSVNVGLTDNFSIGGGILFPFIVYITPKFSFKLTEKFRAGGGLLYAFMPGNSTNIGIAYGVTTFGSIDNNFTIGAGYGFIGNELADRPIFTINGMARAGRKVAFVTENWIIPWTEATEKSYLLNVSYGFRIMGERFTFDIAFINNKHIIEVLTFGIPYVDFVFMF